MNDLEARLRDAAEHGEPLDADAVYARAERHGRALRSRRRRGVGAAVLGVVGVGGAVGLLSRDRSTSRLHVAPAATSTVPRRLQPSKKYQADTTVLSDASHGPELCLAGTLDSLPPQCGGVPITNWDWSKAPNPESQGSTRWGGYHVVGTYDGAVFTLTEPPTPAQENNVVALPTPDFATPCAPPPGGWNVTDPSKLTLDDYNRFQAALQAPDDYVASWTDQSTGRPGIDNDLTHDVMNVEYTGSLDAHRAELAQLWGGPICVSQGTKTKHELDTIASELRGAVGRQLGLHVLNTAVDGRGQVVEVTTVVADADLQRAVDARYGATVVKLYPALYDVPPGG